MYQILQTDSNNILESVKTKILVCGDRCILGIARLLLLLCHLLLRLLIPTVLILLDQLPVNNILIHIEPRIRYVHILMEKSRLTQSLLKTIDVFLYDAILQIIKLTNNSIILVLQVIIVLFQFPYPFIQLFLRIQATNPPCCQPFSLRFPTFLCLIQRSLLLLQLIHLPLQLLHLFPAPLLHFSPIKGPHAPAQN